MCAGSAAPPFGIDHLYFDTVLHQNAMSVCMQSMIPCVFVAVFVSIYYSKYEYGVTSSCSAGTESPFFFFFGFVLFLRPFNSKHNVVRCLSENN